MSTASNLPERINKRKLDDALQSLDDAMGPQQRPTKRPHLVHTLYSTLAKYGINTGEPASTTWSNRKAADLSKTPHLAAILARTAAKTRKVLPLKFRAPTALSSGSTASYEYRPSSIRSLLERLATYKLNTYANKPPAIDALAAAKCGWVNDGKDRLVCGICRVSWVLAGREGMNRDAANALVEKQRIQLVDMHKDGCPWKKRQCDADVYRIPLASSAVMAKEIKTRARSLESVLEGVEIKQPLSSTQVKNLLGIIASVEAEPSIREQAGPENAGEEGSPITRTSPALEPSSTAILTSLFGWSLAPPARPSLLSTTASPSPSWSRASSVAPQETPATPSFPQTPRRPSGLSGSSQINTPLFRRTASDTPIPWSPRGSVAPERRGDTSVLHCSLCHRRLGLWAVGLAPRANHHTDGNSGSALPQTARQIDLLREHRPYCPYVVRSTTVPSLPVAPTNATHTRVPSSTPSFTSFLSSSSISRAQVDTQPGAVEGWRAVLMVVLRYRMGQWQRRKSKGMAERVDGEPDTSQHQQNVEAPVTPPEIGEESWVEVDPVEAMVEGVKSRGGTDLLRYVKGLLG